MVGKIIIAFAKRITILVGETYFPNTSFFLTNTLQQVYRYFCSYFYGKSSDNLHYLFNTFTARGRDITLIESYRPHVSHVPSEKKKFLFGQSLKNNRHFVEPI